MAQSKFANTHARNLGNIFKIHDSDEILYKIPPFQRNYSWDADNVSTLWDDLLESHQNFDVDSISAQYLLGATVLIPEDGTNYNMIIDGQQRLATLTLYFCAIRDLYHQLDGKIEENPNDPRNALYLNLLSIIGNYQIKNGKNEKTGWKLTLNNVDQAFFQKFQEYQHKDNRFITYDEKLVTVEKSRKKSHKLLREAYKTLHTSILDWLVEQDDDNLESPEKMKIEQKMEIAKKSAPLLLTLTNNTLKNIYLVAIDGESNTEKILTDSDAFQIFETLNTRGETLSRSNLVKSLILSCLSTKKFKQDREISENDFKKLESEVQEIWDIIFNETIGKQADDKFLIESIKSRPPYGPQEVRKGTSKPITKNTIYDIIKHRLKKPLNIQSSNAEEFVDLLKDDSVFAQMLNEPFKDETGYPDREERLHIIGIKDLNAEYVRIPLYAAFRKCDDDLKNNKPSKQYKDFKKLVVFMARFFFRYKTIRGQAPQLLEKIILKLPEEIDKGQKIENILKFLLIHDDDEDFQKEFKKTCYDMTNNSYATHIFKTIHYAKHPKSELSEEKLSLEHVFPEDKSKWEDYFKSNNIPNTESESQKRLIDELEQCLFYLGNMTLLDFKLNSQLKNDIFSVKKEKYDTSSIPMITQEILHDYRDGKNLSEWTPDYIKNRTQELYNISKDLWKLPTISCSKCDCTEATIKTALDKKEIPEIDKVKCPNCKTGNLILTPEDWHGLSI
jgi:uncharacterized protein with ParB-like and HNH nuclease domain